MSLQIILRNPPASDTLPLDLSTVEVFPLPDGMFGLAISADIVDSVGEQQIVSALARVEHFDLWAGQWKHPE